ncbi:MAG: hypothetical protein ABL857_07425, partial [Rickettsiales bacterium]
MNFIIGIILGGLGWYISLLVSGVFEPFDSEVGFYTLQVFLSALSFTIAYKTISLVKSFQFVSGIYVGQVSYSYIFGSSEARAWVLLGMVAIISLCIYPIIAGIIGILIGKVSNKKLSNNKLNGGAK